MGKRQHQKDKMYLTCTEWSTFYGGKKTGTVVGERAAFRRLPFDHCALSLQPFEHPLCTNEGIIYDIMSIVPFLKKYGIDPASGKRLDAKKDLLKLKFTKNSEGKYHCPVLFKVFNENSHIVAIKTTGNVFSYEAIEQLNIKPKNYKDLLTDEPFTRKDIITIQDPSDVEKRNLSNFHHLKKNLKVVEDDEDALKSTRNLNSVTSVAKDILDELEKEYKSKSEEKGNKSTADKFNAAHYSTGAVAASSTSTAMDVSTEHEAAILDDDTVRFARIKKKGYVQIQTNLGFLNIELYCDMIPKACENFIKLSKSGYYNGTIFHRSIRNFMIQGGDPTGKGTGGESAWGKPFKDEFKPNLSHQGRGIVSMANTGPNTNKSQFFITFRSCAHLDKKHTIFGKVVGGLDTLNHMERIETDDEDRPVEDIKILKVLVFVDPYQEVDDELIKAREEEKEKLEKLKMSASGPPSSANKPLKKYHSGIGKYINLEARNTNEEEGPVEKRKKKVIAGGFGDFSSW